MSFIHPDFLLGTKAARRLYHTFAAEEPILDYHNHLPPADVAANRQFADLFEIWLEGDHYKWRAMRSNGVCEDLCTGSASPKEKFKAWAQTVPHTLRNPLYHWTHLELKRYFDIDDLLGPDTAERIWERAKEQLATPAFRAQSILERFNVRALCTTDDPTDDLAHHRALAGTEATVGVFPTFRPDKAMALNPPKAFNAWVDRLGEATDLEIRTLDSLEHALRIRHDYFHQLGARLSDHGLSYCPASDCTESQAQSIFAKARAGKPVDDVEQEQFASYLMLFFGNLDAEKGWTKQLHLGAMRNNNSRLHRDIGPDVGCDSIGDWPQARNLARYLDRLEQNDSLPKVILYNLNPADNYVFASMIGNFQDGSTAGRIQWGSGWWFLDQKEGMEWQLNALSNLGLLSRFVGMLTDSRSFMSFPRHEYFRRILCNLLGADIEAGLIPDDESLLAPLIRNVCYGNAKQFLRLPINGRV